MTNDDLKWIGVDLDGTLAQTEYPDFKLEYPIGGAVDAVRKLHDEGWKITIFTARPWSDYQKIEEWLDSWAIPHRRIICGKPLFKYLIDDRNIEFNGNWTEVLEKVK